MIEWYPKEVLDLQYSKIIWSFVSWYWYRRRSAQLQEARERNRVIVVKEEIEMRNLKLYIENQSIIEENEKLREQAVLLHIENQALLSLLQKKLSAQNNNKTKH